MIGASVNARPEVYSVNRVIKPYVNECTLATGLSLSAALAMKKALGANYAVRVVNLAPILPLTWIQVNSARTVNRCFAKTIVKANKKASKTRKNRNTKRKGV